MNFDKVRALIAETLGCDEDQVTPEATLADDLGADSLALAELAMALEEAAGITIEDEETAKFKTVGDIMEYLSAKEA